MIISKKQFGQIIAASFWGGFFMAAGVGLAGILPGWFKTVGLAFYCLGLLIMARAASIESAVRKECQNPEARPLQRLRAIESAARVVCGNYFAWRPASENYQWLALQAALRMPTDPDEPITAEEDLLRRCGSATGDHPLPNTTL